MNDSGFVSVSELPMRVMCATLAQYPLPAALDGEETVCTE